MSSSTSTTSKPKTGYELLGQKKASVSIDASSLLSSTMKFDHPASFNLLVTPDLAFKWLTEHARKNRKVSRASVAQYARDMKENRWDLNGEAIIFDVNGDLMNGYHRLEACVDAEVAFPTWVIVGTEPNYMDSIDQGRVRSFGDVLGWQDEPHASKMASLARFCFNYENKNERTATKLSAPTLNQWLQANPRASEAIWLVNINKDVPVSPTVAMGLYYEAIKHGWDEDLVKDFFTKLKTGLNITDGDPAGTLRRWLIKNNLSHARPHQLVYQVMLTKALNAHLKGQKLSLMRWQRNGEKAEDIPRIAKYHAPQIPEQEQPSVATVVDGKVELADFLNS